MAASGIAAADLPGRRPATLPYNENNLVADGIVGPMTWGALDGTPMEEKADAPPGPAETGEPVQDEKPSTQTAAPPATTGASEVTATGPGGEKPQVAGEEPARRLLQGQAGKYVDGVCIQQGAEQIARVTLKYNPATGTTIRG